MTTLHEKPIFGTFNQILKKMVLNVLQDVISLKVHLLKKQVPTNNLCN